MRIDNEKENKPKRPESEENEGLTGTQWRILAWIVVFIIGFVVMIHEIFVFYGD